MLQNVANLTLTDTAANAFRSILQEKNMADAALRVYVSSGGCCGGVSFGMAIENQVYGNDVTFSSNEIRMIVDDKTIEYLQGATINFINDPTRGEGFVVENPVDTGSGGCACGNEGGHDHDHGDGGCCGGGDGGCSCGN